MQRNHLELTSKGVTYQLIEHWVYTFKNGISADGKWFDHLALEMDPDLHAELTAAIEIPYAGDENKRSGYQYIFKIRRP